MRPTFGFLFLDDTAPLCLDAADSNADGDVDISDGVNTLNYLFSTGRDIPAPGPDACGLGPESGPVIGCAAFPGCG